MEHFAKRKEAPRDKGKVTPDLFPDVVTGSKIRRLDAPDGAPIRLG
jgi:hypothetical protein